MYLARLYDEIDVVVRDQVAEALGDAAEFESQRNLLSCREPRPNVEPAPTAMISPRGPAPCHPSRAG
jgi:hypothetical protein